MPQNIDFSTVDIWQQDESRFGQQGSTTRIWAKTGTRPRKVKQQQFISTYIYGAVCARDGNAFGLVLPYTNTQSMQLFNAIEQVWSWTKQRYLSNSKI